MFIEFLLAFVFVSVLLIIADWNGTHSILLIIRNVSLVLFAVSTIGTIYLIAKIG